MRTAFLATAALAALFFSAPAAAAGSASIPVQPPCNCKPGGPPGNHASPPPAQHRGPPPGDHAGPPPAQHTGPPPERMGDNGSRRHHRHRRHGHDYAHGHGRYFADRDVDRGGEDFDREYYDRRGGYHRHWRWHREGWRGRRWAEGSVDLYDYRGGSTYHDDRGFYDRHDHGWQDGYGRWHGEGTASTEDFPWRMDPWHGYDAHCHDPERDRLIDHDNDGY